ncbi:MAG: IS21 family transposase [Chloroflexi bacterium]|nr:IS21 family transposase [Chloroflexota bacterium]
MKDESLENNIITLHERGWSVRRLSGEFGISRERVSRIIGRNENKRACVTGIKAVKTKCSPKLDLYKEYIGDLLESYTEPPATNQRIFELIKEKGYQGGITILGDYLSGIRGKKVKDPVICIETAPGQRGYHDWSEYYIDFAEGGIREKVTFFSFILGYSRRQYIEVVEDKVRSTLLKSLINTFLYLDGVPKEIKSDNQKACVDRWELGQPVFNKNFLEFATHYRFRPKTIHPGKPQENLKIERPFYYLETNFLNARKFFNKTELKESLRRWLREKNDVRIHRTTRRRPIDLYKEEHPYLQALPVEQYDTSLLEYRIVNNESCVELGGYYYFVPKQYMFEACPVRVSDTEVIIYSPECEEIKRYPIAERGRKDRYIGRPRQENHSKVNLNISEIISRLEVFGAEMSDYIEQIKRHKPGSYAHHLRQILSLKVNYHVDDIIIAVRRALQHKVYESSSIENFLSLNAQKKNEVRLFPENKNYR